MRPIGAEILMGTREGGRPLNAAEDPSESLAVSGAAARQSAERGVIDNRAQERTRGMISHLCALAHSLKSEVMLMEQYCHGAEK